MRPLSSYRRLRTGRRAHGAAILAALALLAAACGGSDTGAPDASGAAAGAPGDGQKLDPSVLSGTATTADGQSFDLGTLADKDLVVWFWAPW